MNSLMNLNKKNKKREIFEENENASDIGSL